MSTKPNGWSRQEEAAVMRRLDELGADLKALNLEILKVREQLAALRGKK